MKKIIVFTGAGISAESGLNTFRDQGGLWEQHRIEDVATPRAWLKNTALVLEFYNMRRKQVLEAKPNAAHAAIAELQKSFDVNVITQNIDDLHERAGSRSVLHLHGEIRKSRSCVDENLIYEIDGWELSPGAHCVHGKQLRPHIVWFGEPVPAIEDAIALMLQAEILIVIGTSLEVYPAAGLVEYVPSSTDIYLVDPGNVRISRSNFNHIKQKAAIGVPELVKKLMNNE